MCSVLFIVISLSSRWQSTDVETQSAASKKESQLPVHIEPLWHAVTPATPQTHRPQSLHQLVHSTPRLFFLHGL